MGQEQMQQARVRCTSCMQHLRIEVAKVETLAATSLSGSRHRVVSRDSAKQAETCTSHFGKSRGSLRCTELSSAGISPARRPQTLARSSAEGEDERT
eukprot:scaffold17566_cov48-Phaeocystis_antarctica.AAC.2